MADAVRRNEHGQPVGPALSGWQPRPFPDVASLAGRFARVEALTTDHVPELYAELCGPGNDDLWTYSPHGPFADEGSFAAFVEQRAEDTTSVALAVRDADGVAAGLTNLMAIQPAHGTVEIGGIVSGRRLQRTAAATEATYLLLRDVFELGYRRCEWKCDALNEPSRQAALRLGYRYEGRFRNAVVVKERSRDTDWFSITDADWPAVAAALEAWLAPDNHGPEGQRARLEDLRPS